jgi:hypothetical protein
MNKHPDPERSLSELDPQDQETLFAAGAILQRLAER